MSRTRATLRRAAVAPPSAADDYLSGGTKPDDLRGHGGDDHLSGHGGDDSLWGGSGNDHLTGGAGADELRGGQGNDWANYFESAKGVRIDLAAGSAKGGAAEGDRIFGIENILGSGHDDRLVGDHNSNSLYGEAGSDRLLGAGGDDELRGGAGADRLDGGGGSDWASYRQSAAGVSIDLETGTVAGGDAEGDRLIAIENLEGTNFYDLMTGNGLDNQFVGGGGGDALHGKDGDDHLAGGDGADFTGGGGIDTIIGGRGGDLIDAGNGRDLIKPGRGNDTVYGGPDPDIVIYDAAWEDLEASYDDDDYSIWVVAPDGTDHIFTALTIATATGTYRYDVPTETWVHESNRTGDDWLGL